MRLDLVVFVALGALAQSAPAQTYRVQTGGGCLNARESGRLRSQVVNCLRSGTPLKVLGSPNSRGYVPVQLPDGRRAHVFNRYVTSSPAPDTRPPTAGGSGGGQMQDCGIESGPVAYNIGNSKGGGIGGECRPRSVVVGFRGSFGNLPRGTTGMGYINPRLENENEAKRFPGNTRVIGDEWNEPVYHDYNSSAAVAYISSQVEHWQKAGRARGQKCVAVDVDNCDVIGAANYGKVLDTIERLNRGSDVQIRVLVKNPQNAGCGQFLRRPIAVGAFMEELSRADFRRLLSMRNPNQMLLFARGNTRGGGHIGMDEIVEARVPNSSVSFDSDHRYTPGSSGNGNYKHINKCTFTPGASAPAVAAAPEATR